MTDKLYKDLFDLYHRDLELMTNLIYEWSGITIPIQVTKYNKIQATLSILPQILSYLSNNLLQIYEIDHHPGYVKINYSAYPETNWEHNIIFESEYSKGYKVYFSLSFTWDTVSSEYLYPDKKNKFNNILQWEIIDRKYINFSKYRSDKKKKSVVSYEELIYSNFPNRRNIPELINSFLDLIPIIDNSIRELESNDVYIFPKFFRRSLDHEFKALWNIDIIPDTMSIEYYWNTQIKGYLMYLPTIHLSISTY